MILLTAVTILGTQDWDKCELFNFSLAVENSHVHQGWVPYVGAPHYFINSSEVLVSGD